VVHFEVTGDKKIPVGGGGHGPGSEKNEQAHRAE
jgi:hypothetical protein